MMTPLKKLSAMGKLITLGFAHYYTCDRPILEECILNETRLSGIDEIKSEMRLFEKQRKIAFKSLVNENIEEIKQSLQIFKNDIMYLKKFLKICKEGHNEIEKLLFQPLQDYIKILQDTILVLENYLS